MIPDLKNWQDVHSRYTYSDGSAIKERIKKKGYIAVQEDKDIINSIVLWKSNREVEIASATIEKLNAIASKLTTPEEALSDPGVKDLLQELLSCNGIRLPMASTILKFYKPQAFPIIDQRAYYQVFGEKLPLNAGGEEYSHYLEKCIEIKNEYQIPFNQIDEVLYQLDKESGRTL